jgi:arylsulfatase A-like enzyme
MLRAELPRDATARNVILVSLDTLRADHLASYGYRHDTAPFIDATFARGGTLFERCVASATTTMASHMTMFTSLPPSVHGVGLDAPVALPSSIAPLPELLQAAGFTTGAITEDGWVTLKRFGRGFDTYQENTGPDLMEPKGQVDVTFGQAKAWLTQHRDERFFLFLHTYQVHYPYVPPPEYAGLFDDPGAAPPGFAADAANYDREIRFVDDTFRDLFATLRALALDDETIIVVTSDHGEEFGEHGCQYHGPHLYEEVAHVPLLMWGPGIPAGRRIAEPVGLLDLLPTILDLAGVAIPAHAMGRSLVPALASGHADPDRRLSTEAWGLLNCGGHVYKAPGVSIRVGARKIARYDRDGAVAYELYDLAADPGERRNLYDATTAGVLKDLVDGYRDDCRKRAAAFRGGGGAPEPEPSDAAIGAEQHEKLRALGYVE